MNDTETDTETGTDPDQLPIFPATAPDIFSDGQATKLLFQPVLAQLADMVQIDESQLGNQTPCDQYTVAELRRHVLGWLQFFAAALNDPTGTDERVNPETWDLAPGHDPAELVLKAAADLERAIEDGAASKLIVMSQARMAGGSVLAMALGEYLVHGWDLADATGRTWHAADEAAVPALTFLKGTIAPEYRHPDAGMFGPEVPVSVNASPFEQLLGFVGRNPD